MPIPEGAIDFDQLWDLYQTGGLNDYTEQEFGLGADYQQYLTPVTQEPFDLIKEMQKNKLDVFRKVGS